MRKRVLEHLARLTQPQLNILLGSKRAIAGDWRYFSDNNM
jgi:hypothetical protein